MSDSGGESVRNRWPGLSESELGLENRQIKGLLRVEGLAYSKAGGWLTIVRSGKDNIHKEITTP